MHAVLLEGGHDTFPEAELRALLYVAGGRIGDAPTSRIRVVDGGEHCLPRMAQSWGCGEVWAQGPDDRAALPILAAKVREMADGVGSAAVRTVRYGHPKSQNSVLVERTLGKALADAGHRIDLDAPDMKLFAWLGDGRIVVGRQTTGRRHVEDRISERRAHFSPVSMHPRRAASLVHLARVPLGGRILDPFCGTGGIVMEAALLGYDAWASDIDPWMVQGTLQTLTDAHSEALDATVFQADIGQVPDLVDGIQGIVTDLPYGGASSTHDEGIATLYERALAAFADILQPGDHAVIGHARPELLAGAAEHGFDEVERHAEFVHKSLTRHFVVLRRK